MSNSKSDVMGTREAAETLDVSVRTVQLWVENGTLKAWKTAGKHRRILRSSVESVLADRLGETTSATTDVPDVLIVEDETTMQTYYEALFELLRPNIPTRIAENGFAGLVEFGRKKPKLMLLDIDMPGMDGIELIKALEGKAYSDVAVIVVTSLSDAQVADRGGIAEDIPVLRKPLGADALSNILDKHFGSPQLTGTDAGQ